jgi:hypothetical protein
MLPPGAGGGGGGGRWREVGTAWWCTDAATAVTVAMGVATATVAAATRAAAVCAAGMAAAGARCPFPGRFFCTAL